MEGRSRADMKGLPRANFIIFFEKGLYRADMKGQSRANMKDWPRANFIIFFKGPV